MNLDCNRKENEMKVTELDTKEVTVTVTRYILNEKVFDLEECPDWAQWAAVDQDGIAAWYCSKPSIVGSDWIDGGRIRLIIKDDDRTKASVFDATDWYHSLIRRPQKVLEVTMADLEKKFGCKVKVVKEA